MHYACAYAYALSPHGNDRKRNNTAAAAHAISVAIIIK